MGAQYLIREDHGELLGLVRQQWIYVVTLPVDESSVKAHLIEIFEEAR